VEGRNGLVEKRDRFEGGGKWWSRAEGRGNSALVVGEGINALGDIGQRQPGRRRDVVCPVVDAH